jgi:hypothetical protein
MIQFSTFSLPLLLISNHATNLFQFAKDLLKIRTFLLDIEMYFLFYLTY